MDSMTRHRFALLGERLASRTAALNAANPEAILARGYAIVSRREDGRPLTAADAVPGTPITIQLADGRVSGRIENEEGR
jgi:exodeoxyribonuclease VII large subunit